MIGLDQRTRDLNPVSFLQLQFFNTCRPRLIEIRNYFNGNIIAVFRLSLQNAENPHLVLICAGEWFRWLIIGPIVSGYLIGITSVAFHRDFGNKDRTRACPVNRAHQLRCNRCFSITGPAGLRIPEKILRIISKIVDPGCILPTARTISLHLIFPFHHWQRGELQRAGGKKGAGIPIRLRPQFQRFQTCQINLQLVRPDDQLAVDHCKLFRLVVYFTDLLSAQIQSPIGDHRQLVPAKNIRWRPGLSDLRASPARRKIGIIPRRQILCCAERSLRRLRSPVQALKLHHLCLIAVALILHLRQFQFNHLFYASISHFVCPLSRKKPGIESPRPFLYFMACASFLSRSSRQM